MYLMVCRLCITTLLAILFVFSFGQTKTSIYLMITVNSNSSTNLLKEWVNAKYISQTLRELGAKDMQVLRGVEDNKAYEKGLNNTVTAYDLMLIFEKMAKGEVVSASASAAMT